jgi:Ca2+-binding EF-hand superfamily protein
MKFWTILAGLALAGILASSVYAQDTQKKKRGGGTPDEQWARIVKNAGAAEGTESLSVEDFTTGMTKNVPEKYADRVKERAKKITDAIAKDGKVAKADFVQWVKDNPMGKKKKKDA